MAFKLFISLLWLSVPLVLWQWMLEDRERFASESRDQARSCMQRRAAISAAAAGLLRQGRQLEYCRDRQALQRWNSVFSSEQRETQRAAAGFDRAALNLWPQSAEFLEKQLDTLDGLSRALAAAARDQEYYLRSEETLAQLEDDLEQIEMQSRYYRNMPGGRGIFLLLQEELAKLEGRLHQQHRETLRLRNAVRDAVLAAGTQEVALQAELNGLMQLMARDGDQSYASNLKRRLRHFDLHEALLRFIGDLASDVGTPA